jgi:sterol desaturase/sphingolipid hydroxylase (fatty acid hydroxylase superfamily)
MLPHLGGPFCAGVFQMLDFSFGGLAGWLLFFPLGLFAWSLLEYVIHGPLSHHMGGYASRMHLYHHRHPEDIFTPPTAWVPLALLIFLAHWLLFGIDVALPLSLGSVMGFLRYEWLHWRIHFREPRNAFETRIRAHHLAHHYRRANSCFGVTTPFWDRVFKTLPESYDEDCAWALEKPVLTTKSNFSRLYGLGGNAKDA